MALTSKPISTISYNSLSFLDNKLNRMLNAHIIEDFRYIYHKGEDGDKDHAHVLLYPNRRIDTGVLIDEFKEVVPFGDEPPLGCLPFRTSKTDHWLMYVLHDPMYLVAHHSDNDGDGKIPYTLEDVITPYRQQLERDYKKALDIRQTSNQKIIDLLARGVNVLDIAYQNNISPSVLNNLVRLYQLNEYQLNAERKYKADINDIKSIAQINGEVKVVDSLEGIGKTIYGERNPNVERVVTYKLDSTTGELEQTEVTFNEEIEKEEEQRAARVRAYSSSI